MNRFFRLYTRSFFAASPRFDASSSPSSLSPRHGYHVQSDSAPERRNPDVYARAGAMRIDFSAAAAANASLDPMDGMHREEEDRRRREALPVRRGGVSLLVVDTAAGGRARFCLNF